MTFISTKLIESDRKIAKTLNFRSPCRIHCIDFMMADSKAKRTHLTLKQKCEILDALKSQRKVSDIAAQFKCDRSTISKIKKNAAKLRQEELTNKDSKEIRTRKSNFYDVEEALLQCFTQMRSKNAILSGPLMLEKATQLRFLWVLKDSRHQMGGWKDLKPATT